MKLLHANFRILSQDSYAAVHRQLGVLLQPRPNRINEERRLLLRRDDNLNDVHGPVHIPSGRDGINAQRYEDEDILLLFDLQEELEVESTRSWPNHFGPVGQLALQRRLQIRRRFHVGPQRLVGAHPSCNRYLHALSRNRRLCFHRHWISSAFYTSAK